MHGPESSFCLFERTLFSAPLREAHPAIPFPAEQLVSGALLVEWMRCEREYPPSDREKGVHHLVWIDRLVDHFNLLFHLI